MKCKLIIFDKKCPKCLNSNSLFLSLNQYLRRLILYTKSILPYDIIALNLWINRSALIDSYNALQNVTIDDITRFHFEFECIHPFQDGNGRIGRFIYLKQLLDNRLALKYMNGESAKEYKKALGDCSKENIKPLVDYIENQKDFITENIDMF